MTVEADRLRAAMRNWASGVTIVTAHHQGIRHGMTVSSFTSVSLDPPTVLISLQKGTRTHDLTRNSGYFGVTILTEQQQALSDRFAGRSEEEDRFEGLDTFRLVSETDLLRDGLAVFDCKVTASYESSTHTLFIGEVLAVQVNPQSLPLVYYDRTYRRLQE